MSRKTLADTGLIFGRTMREGARDPGLAFVMPAMPNILMIVVFTALFERIVELPGFASDDYIDYIAPGMLVLVALLGGGFTSTYLVNDVTSGYVDRIRLLPTRPSVLIAGRLGFEAVRIVPAAMIVLCLLFAYGAGVDNGPGGVLVAFVLVGLLSAAFSGLFSIAGLASRNPQVPIAMQPVGVLVGLLSTALVPAVIMPGAIGDVAEANPTSFMVDGVREALNGSVVAGEVFVALGIALAGIAITQSIAGRMFAAGMAR